MMSLRRSDPTFTSLLLLTFFIAGVGLRLLVLAAHPFDGLYGQDAYAYYDFAGELRLAASAGTMPPAFFWSLGYPALLAGVFALFGAVPEIGQTVNIVLAALLPPLVYVIARQMGLRLPAAFTAALLMLCCSQALQSSIVLMSDIPALFWATLSVCALLAYDQSRRLGWLIAATVTLAFACITRWLYLILFVPFGAAYLIKRGSLRHALIAGLCALLVFLPQLAHSIRSPFPVFNHAWVQGWSPANVFQREFTNPDGTFFYEQPNILFYAHPLYDPGYLAPVFAPLFLLGLWTLRARPALLALLGAWALLPFAFLIGIPYQNIRFALIVTPAVSLLCAFGVDGLLYRWTSRRPILIAALLGVGAAWMLGTGVVITHQFIQRNTRDQTVAAWVVQQLPEGATLYTFDITLTLQHRTGLTVYDLFYETPQSLRAKWQEGRDDFLLVNLWQLHNQWKDREPYNAVAWLQTYRGLVRMGQQGNYTLFKVLGI